MRPFEVIVVDDGSSDDTNTMINEAFPSVRYYHLENSGVSNARNVGIDHATGDWLAFLDSDDEWLPHKLSRQVDALSSDEKHKICHTEEIWIRHGIRVNSVKK